ncbi:metal-dependent transcriptional regulator [Candidatus Woesearchaeota archaeon]|nr:metal-dependent transcriptional regulator [Candidatus Woesearchaeota archaeon]
MKKKSSEDYLIAMYSIYEKEKEHSKGIRSVDIAKELKISKPSVSEMLKKMAEEGFIRFEPYSNIFFKKKGLKEAKRLMHNRRVIEVFLRDVLKYNPKRVDKEAHRLEHAFSEESIKRLDRFLNNPKVSPSGKPIPHGGMI